MCDNLTTFNTNNLDIPNYLLIHTCSLYTPYYHATPASAWRASGKRTARRVGASSM